jgi:hypothetical protein
MGSSVSSLGKRVGISSNNLRPWKWDSKGWKTAGLVVASGGMHNPVTKKLYQESEKAIKGLIRPSAPGQNNQGGYDGYEGFMPEMPEMPDINWADFFNTGGTDVGAPAQVGTLDPLGVRSRRSRGTAGLRGNRDRTLGQSATIASAAARAGLNLPV